MYDWQYYHYFDELIREGHSITDCNPVKILQRIGSAAEYSEILVKMAQDFSSKPGPHLMFSKATDKTLLPDAVDIIRKIGIPCVNLSVDDVTVPFDVRKIGRHFDLCWTTYLGTDRQLGKFGCKVKYLPMAANPYFFKPSKNGKRHVLSFVGSKYGVRSRYVSLLSKANVPVKVRGPGWVENSDYLPKFESNSGDLSKKIKMISEFIRFPAGRKMICGALKKRIFGAGEKKISADFSNSDIGGPLPTFEDMVSCYSKCTASLGILEAASTYTLKRPLIYYRLREFEAPMIGCTHIVRRVPELEESFLDGQEMIFYSTIEECIDKARFYLSSKRYNLCVAIGERARSRAERDHTWLGRFTAICNELGINLKFGS
jgi:hypothetical protein